MPLIAHKTNGPPRPSSVNINAILFSIAMAIIAFANTFAPAKAALFLFFGVALIMPFLNPHTTWRHKAILQVGVLYIYYNLGILISHSPTPTTVYNGLLAILTVCLFLSFTVSTPQIATLNAFTSLMSTIGRILLIFGLIMEFIEVPFRWNSKTGFLFAFLFFIFLNMKIRPIIKFFFFAIWLWQAYLIDDRTYMIAGAVLAIAFLAWPKIATFKKLGTIIILLFLVVLIIVPIIYVELSVSTYRSALDQLALRYTDGRFFSGRDVIWRYMLEDFVTGNVLFGGGHDVSPGMLFGTTNSAHNTFISVLTRTGIVGLILFFALFVALLTKYQKHADYLPVRLSAAFTAALLFKQSSELSLVGNNIALSFISWLIMAYGIIYMNTTNQQITEQTDNSVALPRKRNHT